MTYAPEMLRLIARDPAEALAEVERQRFVGRLLNPGAMWWECWLMPPGHKGYSQAGNWKALGATGPGAHRIVATAVHGPIPAEHEVDHLCFTRNCVNPFHLRVVHWTLNRRSKAQAFPMEAAS